MRAFPLFITVHKRSIVVFGGGAEAAAKLRLVLKTEARVIVVTPEVDPSEMELGHAEHHALDPLAFDFPENTAFAYAATGDQALDAAIAHKARAAGVTVCAADQPAVSDFSTPAMVDRDPVIVAIGTEGTAPVLARKIKADVESLLAPNLGAVARIADLLRPVTLRSLKPGEPRRAFWRSFFAQLSGKQAPSVAEATDLTGKLLAGQTKARTTLEIIDSSADDVELMTVRARKRLDRADVVLADPSVPQRYIELARREALIRRMPFAAARLEADKHLSDGENVVLIAPLADHPKLTLVNTQTQEVRHGQAA